MVVTVAIPTVPDDDDADDADDADVYRVNMYASTWVLIKAAESLDKEDQEKSEDAPHPPLGSGR